MRTEISVAILFLALAAGPARAQQQYQAPQPLQSVEQKPLQSVEQQPASAPPQSTGACVGLPTEVQQTDCLNQLSSTGQYQLVPGPAPGESEPRNYQLSTGTQPLSSPHL